jgi:glucose/arabinose dehydrogenase
MRRVHTLLGAALPAVLLATAQVAAAAPEAPGAAVTPAAATPVAQAPGLQVVADGLDHPRGLVALPFGIVLVAESGQQGTTPCLPPSPGTANKPACLSTTGAVTLAAQGRKVRLVDELASIGATDGTAASGPHDVALTPHGLQVLYGYANNPTGRAGLGPSAAPLGTLSTIDWHGTQRAVADLAAYEQAHNAGGEPGFPGLWSNPFSILHDGADTLVADSGANTINSITPSGAISVVAVLPPRQVPAPPPAGLPPGSMIPMESVPTGMARGPDGAVYVGELTGFPFPVGAARVFKIVPGQAPAVVATGFTNVIDVAFDKQGRLLVLEHATHSLLSGDGVGALKRVEPDGSITTLVGSGLVNPTALSVAPDGSVYIANNAVSVGTGQIVRFVP